MFYLVAVCPAPDLLANLASTTAYVQCYSEIDKRNHEKCGCQETNAQREMLSWGIVAGNSY